MDEVARYYDASKNPENGLLPGAPLRDISQAEYDAYPDWLKASIDAHPMYRKTPLKAPKE
jgi:hypothetical protein